MTALVFVAALALAYLHYVTRGVFVADGYTIYVAAFVLVLATACFAAFVSDDRRARYAAVALILNFAGSHYAWQSPDPILAAGVLDLATAAFLILSGVTRWELTIGGIYLVSLLVGGLTIVGVVPDAAARGAVFIDVSHPDALALLGHGASITLGLGAGDAGRVVRMAVGSRVVERPVGLWVASRLRAVAKVARG